jgi:hypothetical protein
MCADAHQTKPHNHCLHNMQWILHNAFTPPIVYVGMIDQATHCSLLADADNPCFRPGSEICMFWFGGVPTALPNKLCGNYTKDAGFYFRAVWCAVQPPFSLVSGEGASVNMSAKGWRGLLHGCGYAGDRAAQLLG